VKPGRNDACPCGSGRKYKHCCGALAATVVPPTSPTSPAPAAQTEPSRSPGALAALINQGHLAEAEQGARALLQSDPNDGMAWKILGVALGRQGKDALPALRRAAEVLPQDAEGHRNLGAVLHERGQLEEALASLQRSLELEPRDLAVCVTAADILCALGRPREAVPLYQQALRINPRVAQAHNNLGNAWQELGEWAQAVACYRLALEIDPHDAETHCNLGNALRMLGQLEESISSTQRAIALRPGLSVAHNNLGLALAALGRGEESVASFRQAAQLSPAFAEALKNLGNALRDLGAHGETVPLSRRLVELEPQSADNHCRLGNALFESGQIADSAASFRRALELKPGYPAAHVGLAGALRLQGRVAEAEANCRAALAADPKCVDALSLLGDLHGDRGEFAQAQELFERAIATNADSPAVLYSIAAHRTMSSADGDWLQAVQALLAGQPPLEHEIGLRFALGKYYDDTRQYDQAFREYRRANELSRRHAPRYDRDAVTRQVDDTIRRFDSAFARKAHAGASDSRLPVFIIGMPRSGTSLTEQILASHPEVFGAGEVRFWDGALDALTTTLDHDAGASVMGRLAGDYLERLTTSSGVALRVTDKMPANFLYAGLIHGVFPRARIIHMQRHPIDTCLSIYLQNFLDMRAYATDLDNLAHYYGEYVRITDHWRAVLPAAALLEVPYEALIADQEGWTRRMLDFIGLPWDARCLEFHQTARVVITASRWQVRQRINAASVGRWRNYEKYLAPLLHLARETPRTTARVQ
jgi:tetratricopeptide (TPR) repeat protein